MKKKILIVGSKGKMGLTVCEVLKNDYEIVKAKRNENWVDFKADLVIDFGSAESSLLSAGWASKNGVPLIIGSTGQTTKELKEIRRVCSHIPFLICSNFSIGVVLLKNCINQILKTDIDDICIFEKHHKNKKDAPSGTAIELQKYINEKFTEKVQLISERGGEEIGTHKIDFYFGSELIELSHYAFSRKVFAKGVKIVVDFLFTNKVSGEIDFNEIVMKNFKFNS